MGAQTIAVATLARDFAKASTAREILHACVHEGASIGFILPFGMDRRAATGATGSPPHTGGRQVRYYRDTRRRRRWNGATRYGLDAEQAPYAEVSRSWWTRAFAAPASPAR